MSIATLPPSTEPTQDQRPTITRRQLSYAVSQVGAQAAAQAQAEGVDPAAADALMQRPTQIGPILFPPVSMQTLLALQLLMKRRAALGAAASPISSDGHGGNDTSTIEDENEEVDLFALAEAVLVFATPLEAALLLRPGKPAEQWEHMVMEFSARILPHKLREMGEHINTMMGLLKQLGGDSSGGVDPRAGQATTAAVCP